MSDNKSKKRADAKRVALKQAHERRYLRNRIAEAAVAVVGAQFELQRLGGELERMAKRLEAGYPASKRRGKR